MAKKYLTLEEAAERLSIAKMSWLEMRRAGRHSRIRRSWQLEVQGVRTLGNSGSAATAGLRSRDADFHGGRRRFWQRLDLESKLWGWEVSRCVISIGDSGMLNGT
ncbi:MAG: hypothetical protein R3B91_10470 [Planctomycetaceae bacterium]